MKLIWKRICDFALAVFFPLIITALPATNASADVCPSPSPPLAQAQTIDTFTTTEKVVFLTFDAGADVGAAAFILDTLRAKEVHASFAVTGQWAVAYPHLARRMATDGPTLMNHTFSHPSFTGRSTTRTALTFAERSHELRAGEDTLWRIAGVAAKPYFRAPYGDTDPSVLRDLWTLGYRYNISWTPGLDTLGWAGRPKEQIIQTVLAHVSPGAIVLMHVGSASQDGVALPELIDRLRSRGYAFRTVADMLPQVLEFSETKQRLAGSFLAYWEHTGGLPVYGYPLSEELDERNPESGQVKRVQYFERQRFELQPHADPPYQVVLGRLGAVDAEQRGFSLHTAFQRLPRQTNAACTFFPETGHHLCAGFRDYWQQHGLDFGDAGMSFRESLALFGFPISEEFLMVLTDGHWHTVQYFERARFEWHLENPAPFKILLGRLGAEQR